MAAPASQDTGLELGIAEAVVDANSGELDAKVQLHHRSKFCVYLPLVCETGLSLLT